MSENFTNTEWLIKLQMSTDKMNAGLDAQIENLKQGIAMSKILVLMGIAPPDSFDADEKLLDIFIQQRDAMKKLSEAILEVQQLEVLKEQAWKELADSKEKILNKVSEIMPEEDEMLEKLQDCIDHMRGED